VKFFIAFFGFLSLLFFGWALFVFGEMGNGSVMSQWVWDDYSKKMNIAKSINDKKIIVSAGSNVLFGVNSKILSKFFHKRVVNFGVNAGVGLPVILYMTKKVVNKGDVVLMPLEYPMYSYDGKPGLQMIDFILGRVPELFWKLTLKEQFYILWHVSLKRVWNGYFYKSNRPMMVGVYGVKNIDKNGDQIKTEIDFRDKNMQKELDNMRPEKYGARFDKNALGWRYLEEFVKWCKKRDVRVVFMPSTLMKDRSYFTDKKERWFYKHIAKIIRNKGWKFVGKPYLYMYEKKMYFNTKFHLINKARKKRTLQMVEDLNSN